MVSKEFTIKNKVGLHARPASLFVKKAKEYSSNISISAKGEEVDGKSMLSVLTLGAAKGTLIVIKADGDDEEEAVDALINTLNSFED
ncbi:MAG: HPr family phosphocarrier protein [Eubacteriaceae bacterium]|nr:HPr family phosphocarrier protein [Eubacteriaceae bacterium]